MSTSTATALMPAFATALAATPIIDSDHALVRASVEGDAGAFETLYRRHIGRVHGVIVRLVGGQGQRADDLTQDAFVTAWRALSSYRFESAFGTWLYRLAANTALMELRARRGRPDLEGDDDQLDSLPQNHPSDQIPGLQLDLDRAVASLPPRARAVLVLYDVEGWTHEDIARELDMAVGTSKAQLHRARRLLRARLGDQA